MAKLVRPKIAPPKADFHNYDATRKAEATWLETLKAQLKADNPDDELAGEEIKFQVADNYARYVVVSSKPLQLIHLTFGDAYTYQYITRLRLSDVQQEVQKAKRWAALFTRK